MKIRHQDLEIPKEEPFRNCQLNRRTNAEVLTSIVSAYKDGFVLAVNNEWGSGKTTFIKMWQQHLVNNGFKTLYFNAWENDFNSDPLVALMSELSTLKSVKNRKSFHSVLKKGAVLAKNILPALAKKTAERHLGDINQLVSDSVENTTKAITGLLEDRIKEYTAKKKTINDFRTNLEEFIETTTESKPLVFFIDELDRCRPTYAVEVLEQMKHLFAVSGIAFVIAIDKHHLASSVRGFYGSENINTDEYLRRFFDLEYTLPQPSTQAFCNYLYQYFALGDFFASPERQNSGLTDDGSTFLLIAEILLTSTSTTLRQQEKIFSQTRLILMAFHPKNYTLPTILFYMIYLKAMRNSEFQKIVSRKLTLQELSDLFSESVPQKIDRYGRVNFVRVEAHLLLLYCYYRNDRDLSELLKPKEDGTTPAAIVSKIAARSGDESLANALQTLLNRSETLDVGLGYLIGKINLLEPLNVPPENKAN